MIDELNGVLGAAEALLVARHAGLESRPAWMALENAVALVRDARPPRAERAAQRSRHHPAESAQGVPPGAIFLDGRARPGPRTISAW